MAKTPRNASCPCGSGLKYKRCCLSKEKTEDRQVAQTAHAMQVATDWIEERYGHILGKTTEEQFLGDLDEDRLERLGQIPPGLGEMLTINATEYILAEATLCEEGGEPFRVKDLLFGVGGPLLDVNERKYLEGLFAQPLGLYEVVSVRQGEGVGIRDLEDSTAPTCWVRERSGSESMQEGLVLGARLVEFEGILTFSGALYPLRERVVVELLERRRAVRGSRLKGALKVRQLGSTITNAWLNMLTDPPPELVDKRTGDPILLVTDHYEILDPPGLAAALAEEPNVIFDEVQGWTLVEEGEIGSIRPLLSLNLEKEGRRLENFAPTLGSADSGRKWFEGLAGHSVRHLMRESTDPAARSQGEPAPPRKEPALTPPPGLFQDHMEKVVYKHWTDEPIPLLGDKTPRQCLETKAGRIQVIGLLESYERQERVASREQGRPPIDHTFLWLGLGLERPEKD